MDLRLNDKRRKSPPLEPLLTIRNVADVCCVSTKTIRRWIQSEQLVAIRLGRQWRIAKKDLERFLSDHRT
ncbi:MAG: helix-turn-helix domain-containing protein [Proteobacteria bacterium]|nr:helix-turn-helix domain-containing protein [Pseudomonadota bacterium]